MIFLLVLLAANLVGACPDSCKCIKGKATCDLPEARNLPVLEWPQNMAILDLSGNNLLNILSNSLANFSNVQELILDRNKIYYLEDEAFKGFQSLKKLSIQNNNLHFIEDDVFSDLTQLEELYLAGNLISDFPNLQHNKNLKQFCISSNNIENIPENALKNNTRLTALKLKNNKLTSLLRHAFPDDVTSFVELNLVGNNIRDIPEVLKEMRNLEKLSLCHNPIKVFQADELSSFKKLRSLSLTNIGLTEILPNVFNLATLEELHMSRNKLSGNSLLNLSLSNLKKLVLARNPIKNVPGNAFGLLHNLEELDLSNCEISRVDQNSFKILDKLKTLNLNGNGLAELPYLDHNQNLEHLDLSNNYITSISLRAFGTLQLKELLLSNNTLDSFAGNSSDADLSTLNSLDLSYNQFESIPPAVMTSMHNLESLNISFNNLSYVESIWFKDMSKLETLNLKGNKLVYLNESSFGNLAYLKHLFLCRNQLQGVASKTFSRLPQLEVLTADKNELTEIDKDTFANNPSLKKISLSFNRISSLSKLAFTKLHHLMELWLLFNDLVEPPKLGSNVNLRVLGLCGNNLGSLPQSSLFGPRDLQVLLLKNTGLTKFSEGILEFPEKLKYLKLVGNNLTAIPTVVERMKSLEKLVLSDNPIEFSCWSNFVGLNHLKELYLDNLKLQHFAFTTLFQMSPALRTFHVGSNPWHCGCNLEMFALGIDGKRANVVIQDRNMMQCNSPKRYQGKRIDYLSLGDFKQCKASSVKEITQTSATLTLPNVESLALDHPHVQHHVSYQPLGGGRKKTVAINSGQRSAMIDGLTPHTTYLVCVNIVHSDSGNIFEENGFDEKEKCHKITTLKSSQITINDGRRSFDRMTILYSVLSGVLGFALIVTLVSLTIWCRRARAKKHHHFANISSASDEMEVRERAPKNRNDQREMNGNTKQGDETLVSNSNGSHINEAYDAIKTRTKV